MGRQRRGRRADACATRAAVGPLLLLPPSLSPLATVAAALALLHLAYARILVPEQQETGTVNTEASFFLVPCRLVS
ncbi:Protein of unknown function [Gryllus bimaculatus]|nr:Protein of unknown function [Gryllus bimaculatus]